MNSILIGRRRQKSVWLDEGMIAFVTTYAAKHHLNFSRAIEALALLGLQDTKAVGNAWLAFNIAGGHKNTLAAQRQRATLELVAELRAGLDDLMRLVVALAATERHIPLDEDDVRHWNVLTEATGLAADRQSLIVEQLLHALDDRITAAAQARLRAIEAERWEHDTRAMAAFAQDRTANAPVDDVE